MRSGFYNQAANILFSGLSGKFTFMKSPGMGVLRYRRWCYIAFGRSAGEVTKEKSP